MTPRLLIAQASSGYSCNRDSRAVTALSSSPATMHDAEVVDRPGIVGVLLQQGFQGGDRAIQLPGHVAVVGALGELALAEGQAIAQPERPRESRLGLRRWPTLIEDHRPELPPRHRESAVSGHGLLEERNAPIKVGDVLGSDRLRVLSERFERSGSHLRQRRIGADAPQRFADLLPQPLGDPVYRVEDARRVARRLPRDRQHFSGFGAHELRRDQDAGTGLPQLSRHHRLDPRALGDFARHAAPRSVSRRWITPGTANGARPAPASRRLWSIVARTTTGSPSASSRTAAGKNQSGRPAKVRSAHATPSTAEPLSAQNPSVRAR